MPYVNDVHSRLNRTNVLEVLQPGCIASLVECVRDAGRQGRSLGVCGGRHAMGGQQFARGCSLLDMTALNQPIRFDPDQGHLEIGAGAVWPDIIRATRERNSGVVWGIRQKQTGADALTLGGAIAANVHGRGLLMGPIVDDIEDVTLVDPDARVLRCSRREHPELFSLVVGGYGMFGIVAAATLRLSPRRKIRRIVNILDIDDAAAAVYRRIDEGCLYGDFQYAIDARDRAFLRRGVMACYEPADNEPVGEGSTDLSADSWTELLHLAHTDKRRAFDLYAQHYLRTHGQVYWSDLMQLSTYLPSYSEFLARRRGPKSGPDESLVIGELFVPPAHILRFLESARTVLRETGVEDIYGTIRVIRRDDTSFLAWAREDLACIIFNLRTPHTASGLARTADAFRGLIDAAADLGGSYYLTYHRYATSRQVERCHPRFREFLALKRRYDPHGVFQSDWYTHHLGLFGDRAPCSRAEQAAQHA